MHGGCGFELRPQHLLANASSQGHTQFCPIDATAARLPSDSPLHRGMTSTPSSCACSALPESKTDPMPGGHLSPLVGETWKCAARGQGGGPPWGRRDAVHKPLGEHVQMCSHLPRAATGSLQGLRAGIRGLWKDGHHRASQRVLVFPTLCFPGHSRKAKKQKNP